MQRLSSSLRARPWEWLLLAVLLLGYPLSALLTPEWSVENGILENLQVVVLAGGMVHALMLFQASRPARSAMLALCAAPMWLLLAARELSWGRVLLPEPGQSLSGLAGSVVWLQPLLRPVVLVLVLWMLLAAWRHRIDQPLRSAFARRTPWLCLGIVLAAGMGSTCAEGHMGCSLTLPATRSQAIEELVELVAYAALWMIQFSLLQARGPRAAGKVGSQVA